MIEPGQTCEGVAMKMCKRCGKTKPATTEYFHRRSDSRVGLVAHCKECRSANSRTEERRVRERARYQQNQEKLKARSRANYWSDPEAARRDRRDYYSANREERKKYAADHYRANPQRHREWSDAYRARRKSAPEVERISRSYVYERDSGRCHLCGKYVSREAFTLDHLVPLSRGGSHTARNLRVAHKSCNSSRRDGRLPAQLLLIG